MLDQRALEVTAEDLLHQGLDPVPCYLLLREGYRLSNQVCALREAREAMLASHWVARLAEGQWADGSWGRLHTRHTRAKQPVPTTEAGVQRALALGLTKDHPVLARASAFLKTILDDISLVQDPAEKNDRWPTGVRLFAAATLAQIEPDASALDGEWSLWLEITQRSFASGRFDPKAEENAHALLTGATIGDSYLRLNNPYSLSLLASRSAQLPGQLEHVLLQWLFSLPHGMRYFDQPLGRMPALGMAGSLERWLRSHELLSSYPSWHHFAQESVVDLCRQRTEAGMWDFGARASGSFVLPYSDNWRRRGKRAQDWTVRMLQLLKRAVN